MIILGLDCATRTGWAVGGGTRRMENLEFERELVDSGVWDLKPGFDQSVGMRYVKLRSFLIDIIHAYPQLQLIAYERAHMRGRAATEYALGYVATIQAIAQEFSLQVANIPTGTLKKFATGRGNAEKKEMVRAASDRWGLTTTGKAQEDEADAIWVWAWAQARYGTILKGGMDGNSESSEQEGREEGSVEEGADSPGAQAATAAGERSPGGAEGPGQDQRGDRRTARLAEAEDGLGRSGKGTPRRSPQSLAQGRVQGRQD